MKLLKIVPEKTSIRFIAQRKVAFTISGALMILSVVLFFTEGLNFGIDFRGGTLIEIGTPQTADLSVIRATVG